ncbi:Fibronectin type-III domain-containing protein [Candidatus Magnetomoraceae bacterium gMMP-15]
MKKICTAFLFTFFLPSLLAAYGQYKITANIIEKSEKCYVTGKVMDARGRPIYPADVILECGDNQRSQTSTDTEGEFMENPLPCCFTIKVQNQIVLSNLCVENGDLQQQDLIVASEAILEHAIQVLQILSNLPSASPPPDQLQDNKTDLKDAIRILQILAQIRDDKSVFRSLRNVQQPKSVKIWKDTNGDGIVDQLIRELTTDAYGYVEIDNLPQGSYTLIANNSDNSNAIRMENIVVAGSDVHLKTLRLKEVASISGIISLEGESDYSDIHVRIPGTSFDAYTDSAGKFTISNIPEGTYSLKISKDNFSTIVIPDISLKSGKNTQIETVKLSSTVGNVNGTVWLQGETDYTGILITLRKEGGSAYLTTTNALGEYVFKDISIGNYELVAIKSGFISKTSSFEISSGSNQQNSILLSIDSSTGTLKGNVILSNRSDHSGIQISLAGTQYMAVTADSGDYTINDIPEGTYTAFMKAEGYAAARYENVQINTGSISTQNGSLTARSGTSDGSVIGTAYYSDQSDHSGISIKVEGTDIPLAGTDTNGAFIISNVPAGTYTLLFTQANYKTVKKTGVVVSPWNTAVISTVRMIPPTGSVRGRVRVEGTDPGDDVYTDVDVYAQYDEGTSTTTHPSKDNEGGFLIENVKEGIVNIIVIKPGYLSAELKDVKILAGQTSILEEVMVLKRPPEAPTGVSASQGNASSVIIEWTKSVSPDVSGYNVYYGIQSNAINQKTNTELISCISGEVCQYTVTGLQKGTTYYFAIAAEDTDGLISSKSPADGSCFWTLIPKYKGFVRDARSPLYTTSPFDIALNANASKAYVSLRNGAGLAVVDLSLEKPEISAKINIAEFPMTIAMNPSRNELYVLDTSQSKLFFMNTNTDIVDSTSMSVGSYPRNVIVSSDGNRIYVCSEGTVKIINAQNREIEATILLDENAELYGMSIANGKLYVAGIWTFKVYIIDLTNHNVKSISIGKGVYDIVAKSDSTYVYVSNNSSDGDISVINTQNDTIEEIIKIKNEGELNSKYPKGMAVSGNILYVLNNEDNSLTMINTDTNTKLVLNEVLPSGGNGPENLAVSPDGDILYIVHSNSESVEILGYGD